MLDLVNVLRNIPSHVKVPVYIVLGYLTYQVLGYVILSAVTSKKVHVSSKDMRGVYGISSGILLFFIGTVLLLLNYPMEKYDIVSSEKTEIFSIFLSRAIMAIFTHWMVFWLVHYQYDNKVNLKVIHWGTDEKTDTARFYTFQIICVAAAILLTMVQNDGRFIDVMKNIKNHIENHA